MRFPRPAALQALAVATGLAIGALAMTPAAAQLARPEYVPGEIIVKFKDGVRARRASRLLRFARGQVIRRLGPGAAQHVRVPEGSVQRVVRWLRTRSEIAYVEPNYLRYLDLTPSDPDFDQQWGLENIGQTGGTANADIDAPEAWDLATGDGSVVVAVIDSGIDPGHPDLVDNLWTNPGEIAGNGIDDDGNGLIDDVIGWDFADGDSDPTDANPTTCAGHGTHTAGTVGARGDNGIGVTGVNWDVQIMPLRVFKRFLLFCSGADADIIAAINYAASNGVRVSNNSYGGGPYSQAVFEAIRASRSVFVAAAGNESNNNDANPSFPASYDLPGIISVAATDHDDRIASFSNFGFASVDLGAPGADILSTQFGSTYGSLSGTSMASPHVAGAVALLMGHDPGLTNNEVSWRVRNSTDFTGLPVITGGRLNLHRALTLLPNGPLVTVEVTPVGSTTISRGGSFSYEVAVANTTASVQTVFASIVAVFPDGREFITQSRTLNIPPFVSGSEVFTETIPAAIPAGTYELSGRVEVLGTSFDEDIVAYQVQ